MGGQMTEWTKKAHHQQHFQFLLHYDAFEWLCFLFFFFLYVGFFKRLIITAVIIQSIGTEIRDRYYWQD